ncbi:hypothetical protein K6W16_01345 [Burkholderia dolosa]|jgi:hypothetical protein|uniref:Uncharacterized protein n=1 Tax=Burkholderia dolosa TaxID=152500 RepID=A0A892IBZ5_9BURK|nr:MULTISPECIES: hypothetical protein [Burkholderia]ETP62883.1 membrane protein [Burkholderia dolosa PC543]MBR8060755.1 hypothetical protein [Burkholderia dolosa]MBR8299207.1 hypothetical protein [Burkholderia dolosa]MBR8315090.1 hypothetical protein [Burkholderia dolosa]MBR8416372.1 hypothetical protein [Burkholderia dolosa]
MGMPRFGRWRARRTATPEPPRVPGDLAAQLCDECEAMARYALHHGLPIEPELVARLAALIAAAGSTAGTPPTPAQQHALAAIHRKLATLVAPATPQAVTLLDMHRRHAHPLAWLGPVPLIRLLTGSALGFLVAVVLTSLSPQVSGENIDRGFLQSNGTQLLWNTTFLLCCAGLGASFATLFQAHHYVAASTYDPKYDASYGARLILGVIAGLILVEMLPAHLFAQGSMHSFGRPALAMLGGFSATAVHRVLQRLVETLETLVQGDRSADVGAALAANRARAASERAQWQGELAASLLDLQQSLDASTSTDAIRARLAEFTRTMLAAHPSSGGGDDPFPPGGAPRS